MTKVTKEAIQTRHLAIPVTNKPQIEQQAIFNITQRHTPLKINYYEIEKDRSKTNDSVTKKKKQNFQNQNISSSFPLQPSLQNSLQLSSGQENKTFLQTPNNNKIIFENINTSQQREEKVVFVKEVKVDVIDEKLKTEIIIDSNITPPIIKHPINSSSDMSSGMSTITTTKSSNNHNNNGGSGRTGILSQKEDKYPISSTPYFPTKNSGIEKWPTPSIDTTRPERAGRMVMEGWPSSPRSRMKLASPRFKSLNDLEEGPEGNDQPGQKSYNQNASLNSYCSSSLASSTNNNISDNSGDNRLILTSKEPNLDTMGRNDREIIVEEEEVEEGFKVEDISSLKLSDEFFNSGGFSGSRRTLGISLNSPKRPFYHDNNSGSSISSIDGKDSEDEHQQKQKPKNEKRLSEVQPSTNEPTANNRSGMIGREHYKNSSRLTTRLFSSIQSRRTVPQISRSKNVKITTDSSPSFPMAKTPSSELSSTSTPSTPLTTIQTPLNSATTPTAWKWPKRPFSPAREKQKEELIKPGDNPAEHIGKVGNLWAKKTLGQLRKYHQRHSPSILSSKSFGSSINMAENSLETINEEDEDEDIGIWSSEEVDLTAESSDDKKLNSPSSSTNTTPTTTPSIASLLNPNKLIEEIVDDQPRGIKVSPERLTINKDIISPITSTTSRPSNLGGSSTSSLSKNTTKPLFETTFTISNITDEPLRYEILWPAFRFDITPAYGIVKPQCVILVKVSVLTKHLIASSKREDIKDSRKFMGILKSSENTTTTTTNNVGSKSRNVKNNNNGNVDIKTLMSTTRILVFCENGERKEVLSTNDLSDSSDNNNSFIKRFSSKGISRTVDDLMKAAKVAPALRKTGSKSRPSSPEGTSGGYGSGYGSSGGGSDSYRSSMTALERKSSTSPSSFGSGGAGSRSRTPDDSKPVKQLPQRKNFIYIGVPGNVNCPTTTVRETNSGIFRIHNQTNKPVTWHLTTATNPFLRKSDSAGSSQKINDEVFLIMKTSGFLRPGSSERVPVSFRPLLAGTYYQSFMLEDSMNSEATGGLGGVSVRVQGEGKFDVTSNAVPPIRRTRSMMDFEVATKEVRIAATRVGKKRSVGIKISNPSNQLIRVKCKCELVNYSSDNDNISDSVANLSVLSFSGSDGGDNTGSSGANNSGLSSLSSVNNGINLTQPQLTTELTIPIPNVQIKPHTFMVLPVRFQPKKSGEIRGVVTLQAVGRSEVKVDIIAEGILETLS
ncbi:13589_t:CDS:10 [Entrophospora sp. SA101]|nr:24759_t:CDS:10 [Entrophospora sp. SA101]CAJ0749962.1 13589_t:CDS:10 [Entrophospora sp. SA101]